MLNYLKVWRKQATEKILNWVKWYNLERPHSALGCRTPFEVFKKEGNLKFGQIFWV